MRRFWDLVTRPILLDRWPRRIVEIGSQAGEGTRLILELCQQIDAHADIVDPKPPRNLQAIQSLLNAHGAYHDATSLEALKTLPVADVYLIDGDHNWYTVHHELLLIHERAVQQGDRLPLVILHDVAWPYARRDLYYDPATIPEAHRHEAVQGGLSPGREEVVPGEGLNHHLTHARREGGPRNGVLTALEDFLACQFAYQAFLLPGYNGLGFLVPAADLEQPHGRRIAAVCADNAPVLGLLELVEHDRMSALAREETLRTALLAARQATVAAQRKTESVQQQLDAIMARRGYRALEALGNLRRWFR